MKFLEKTIDPLIGLPRSVKRGIVLCLDAGICVLTVWLALYLRLGEFVALSGEPWPAAVFAPLLAIPIFIRFGLYRAVFRYFGSAALVAIANAVIVYGIIYFSAFTLFSIPGVPRTVGIIQPILLLVFVGASRVFGRYWLSGRYLEILAAHARRRVLIYGAGQAGRQLAAAIGESPDMYLEGFVDDDEGLQGSIIGGKPVIAPGHMAQAVRDHDITEILLAVPTVKRWRRNAILAELGSLGVAVRTLPGIMDIARGSVTVTDLRPLEIEDLLARDPVTPDVRLMEKDALGKVVLVTGAGGSIGSELCRQIVEAKPAGLLLLESSEFALYEIHKELENFLSAKGRKDIKLVPFLCSVLDERRMAEIFSTWRPDTVYHAAAFKHVPLVEHNVVEGVRNNAIGTWICARAAIESGADNFVLISTDKAVRPTNVMGASKRLAELGLQALAGASSKCCFSMVRFGNVLGSSGSVVPLFREQIRVGGPVTVTHPDITRYFMTIPEAAQLVIQAGAMAKGGEVFVLDMGKPVRVLDLAKRMIELSGLQVRSECEPEGDIEIVFNGLRPGEKLYEELLIGENPLRTGHPRIMMANEPFYPLQEFTAQLTHLRSLLDLQDPFAVRNKLVELIEEYRPESEVVDNLRDRARKTRVRVVSSSSAASQSG